ncbi:MAG: DUF1298 domain-containing protein [Deltaproteobacteria bacterium]|nr:DUF1298 domain-containing protein [Deltaproteobacteria bacterium]
MVKLKLVPASDTPLNGKVGPHRIVDWLSTSLGDVKAIRKALGCSVNDVVLGTVTGAVREFLIDRQVRPEGIEFRVATPVNVRPRSAEGKGGNYVSTWIVTLPVDEADPLKRVARIHEATQEFKDSHVESVIDLVEAIHEWIPIDLQAIAEGTQNLYVTNVPAELLEIYIQPPLIENLGLTIGILSYNGRVCWGLCGDLDRLPDLGSLSQHIQSSYRELAQAAGVDIRS